MKGKLRYLLTILRVFAFLFLPFSASSQDNILPVEIFGNVVSMPSKKALDGVVVSVYKGNFKVDEIKTDKKGKFSVFISPNSGEYQVRFSYPLHVTMFCLVNSAVPDKFLEVDKGHSFPDLPMWPTNSKDVNVYAFKEAFAKIRWEKKMFGEDLAHFEAFKRKMNDLEEMASIRQKEMDDIAMKEKIKKDKEEKERLEREQKEKELKEKELVLKQQLQKEKEEREKFEKEQKDKLAKQKLLLEEQRKLEEELEKTKNEDVSEEIKLKQEKEIKEKIKKKNEAIATQYKNELLIMVAENEKRMKESQMLKKKAETDASAVSERMKREQELKAELDAISKEIEDIRKKNDLAKKEKFIMESGIIKTAAQVERMIKIENTNGSKDPLEYKAPPVPKIIIEKKEGFFSLTTTITISIGAKKCVLKKETYTWDAEYFYLDDTEIDRKTFIAELLKYKNLK